jgi:hypothetical protein
MQYHVITQSTLPSNRFAVLSSLPPELVPFLTTELTLSEIQALRLVNCAFRYVCALSVENLLADDGILAPDAWNAFPRAHRLHITKVCKRGPSSCIQAPSNLLNARKENTAWSAAVQDLLHTAPSYITGVTVEVEDFYPTMPWHDAADEVAAALCNAPIARNLKQLNMGAAISAPAAIQLLTHLPAVSDLGIRICSTSASSHGGGHTPGPCSFPPRLGRKDSKLEKLRLAVDCRTDFINPTSLAQLFSEPRELHLDLDLPSIAQHLAPGMPPADAVWKLLGSCQQLHRLRWTCTRKQIRMGCGPESAHVQALRVLGQAQELVTRLLGLPELEHLHLPWAGYNLVLLSRAPQRLKTAELYILEASAAELQQAAGAEQAGQLQQEHGPQQLRLTVADLRLSAGPAGKESEAATAGCLARLLPGLLELTISSPQLGWLDPWRRCTLAQLAAALEGHRRLTSLDAVQLTWYQQQQCTYDQLWQPQSRWVRSGHGRYVPDGPDVWRSALAKLMSCPALQSLSLWPPGQSVAPAWAASRACRGLQHLAWGADGRGRRKLRSICFYPSQQQCIAAWRKGPLGHFTEVCSFSLADAALLLGPGGGPAGERDLIGLPLDVVLDVMDLKGLLRGLQEARSRRQELLEVKRESVVWGYPTGAPEVQEKVQQVLALVADILAAQELLLALQQVVRKARQAAAGAAAAAPVAPAASVSGVKWALQQVQRLLQLRGDGGRPGALVNAVVQEVGQGAAVQLPAGWPLQLHQALVLREEVGREVQALRRGKKVRWQSLPPGKTNWPVDADYDLFPDACCCPRWHCELRGVTGCKVLQLAL